MFWPRHPKITGGLAALGLTTSQMNRLLPILKTEDHDIDLAVTDNDISNKQGKIDEIHKNDEAQIKQIISPEQYQELVEIERQHGGKALSQ
jgi:hypothetical protein